MLAAGEKPVDAAGQVLGSRISPVHDHSWMGRRKAANGQRRAKSSNSCAGRTVCFGLIVWPEGNFAAPRILIGLVVFWTSVNTVNDVF